MVQPVPKIEAPFDLGQIDHTLVDVILVDDIERMPIAYGQNIHAARL